MLRRRYRLTQEHNFWRVKRRGRHRASPLFGLGWVKNHEGQSRFGFIATKRVGNAVQRHHALRLLREAVRLSLKNIQLGYDFVLVARKGVVSAKMQEVKTELERVLRNNQLLKV